MKELHETYEHRHPSTVNILKWLIPNPKIVGIPGIMAATIETATDEIMSYIEQDSPELTAGLRKLLEAKDCFVRAALDEKPGFWTDR